MTKEYENVQQSTYSGMDENEIIPYSPIKQSMFMDDKTLKLESMRDMPIDQIVELYKNGFRIESSQTQYIKDLSANFDIPYAGATVCSFPLSSGWVTNGRRRGNTTVYFSLSYFNPYPYKKVKLTYNVSVKSQKKNIWGAWNYAPCPNECWIAGTWTVNFDYMDAVNLGYAYTNSYARSYSYPHPNCINNFQTSINPITGGAAPYPSSFIFTAPSGFAFLDVRMTPVHWSVSVPGGANGINCSVNCP